MPSTIEQLCRRGRAGAPCLGAPGREHASYEALWNTLDRVGRALRGLSIERNDRVALVLDDGPVAAAGFLAVASHATCAPLNPRYKVDELVFYLRDLGAKLVVTTPGVQAAHEAAERCGISVAHAEPRPHGSAEMMRLLDAAGRPCALPGVAADPAGPDDVALVLHTSGTTARPKIVPLLQRRLVASACSIARWLALCPDDRALGVMPLFHIHGLVGVLLASIAAGASVCCTSGMDAQRFESWLVEDRPTWYSAVPTMHQAVLARARQQQQCSLPSRLRFVRSSSSPLPPPVHEALERLVGVPVIEAYGMTEACHQICSNPLPPGRRRPGSVGLPAGPEVAILGDQGRVLPPGEVGEVVLRGPTILDAYEDAPEANQRAFHRGWFRTGDLGHLGDDGYLVLVGRIKEMINRGGEKIAPPEIDDVLLRHPGVRQAFAFAIPDARLGEAVAAVVAPVEPGAVTEQELRDHAARHLADFKVPVLVRLVDEVPRGPTGKIQRRRLPELLGLADGVPEPVESPDEATVDSELADMVVEVCRDLLELPGLRLGDDLLLAGADSLALTRVQARLRERSGVTLPLHVIHRDPRPIVLATALAERWSERVAPEPLEMDDGPCPLTPAQRAIWLQQQLRPHSTSHTRPFVLRVQGPVPPKTVAQALRGLHLRHPCLRSRFVREGARLGQRFDVAWPGCTIEAAELHEDELHARVRALLEEPVVLERGACRYHVLPRAEGGSWAVIVAHHVAVDGNSEPILVRELAALLGEQRVAVPDDRLDDQVQPVFERHARQQARAANGAVAQRRLAQWVEVLDGVGDPLELCLPRPEAPVAPSHANARVGFEIDREHARAVARFAREHGVTPFAVLLAAYERVLRQHTEQAELCLATPVADRPDAEHEHVVGMFTGFVLLRMELPRQPSLAERARWLFEELALALDRGVVSLPELVAALRPPRHPGRSPLVQATFAVQAPRRAVTCGAVTVTPCPVPARHAKFELSLDLTPTADGWDGFVEYDVARLTREGVGRVVEDLLAVIETEIAAPMARAAGASHG